MLTPATDSSTLKNFYRKVQPAGFWSPVKREVLEDDPGFKKQLPFSVELFNTVVAMIAITAMYVSMLYLVLHRLEVGFGLLGVTLVCVVVLYFSWYKTLPPASTESNYLDGQNDGEGAATEAA